MSADRISSMNIGHVILLILIIICSSQAHPIAPTSDASCPSFCTCNGEYLEICVLRSTFEYPLIEKRVVKHLTILECSAVEELSHVNATILQLLTKCDHSKVEENLALFQRAFPNLASFLNNDGTTVCSYRVNSDESFSSRHKLCDSNSTDGVSTTLDTFTSTSAESGASMDSVAAERDQSRETGMVGALSVSASLPWKGSAISEAFLLLVKPTRSELEASLHEFSSSATPSSSLYVTDAFLLNGLVSVSQTPLGSSTETKNHFQVFQSAYNFTASSNQSSQILAKQAIFQYRFLAVIISSSLSGLGLLLNFSVILSLCTHKKISLARVFGMSLMFFNCLLALYGLGMSLYLYFYAGNWELRMCQGLTSLKLFSLGSIAWTLMMMTFRYSIRQSSEDERDAIFKGIVYIFEGMMLVAVFAVLSWVKLNEFQYWCSIIRPETTVECILVGAEIWHYSSLFLLIVRYPICKILTAKQKVTVEAGKHGNEHATLVMVIASLVVWVSAYSFTYFADLRIEIKAFVRLNSLVLPVLLQPLLFSSRNTSLCTCDGGQARREKTRKLQDKLLSCTCQDGESCSACETRIELLNLRDGKNDSQADDLKNLAFLDRKDNTVTPVLVCRSPLISNRQVPKENALATAAGNLDARISQRLSQTIGSEGSASEKRVEVSLHKKPGKATGTQDTLSHENNSKYRRQSPVPSFISLEDRTEKGSASSSEDFGRSVLGEAKPFQPNSENEFDQSVTLTCLKGRMSRGPTFYPIKSKAKEELGKKSKSQGSDSIDALINQTHDYEDTGGAISEKDSLNNASDTESTSKECSKTEHTAGYKRQSRCENENDFRTRVSLPDNLEWDQGYSTSHPSNSQRENNEGDTIYSPPYSKISGENDLFVGKSSMSHKEPRSLISSTLYEWEPYGVDEPNSARAHEFKGQLEQNEKPNFEES